MIIITLILISLFAYSSKIHNHIINNSPYNEVYTNHKLKVTYLYGPCPINTKNSKYDYFCQLNNISQHTYNDEKRIFIELIMNECLTWWTWTTIFSNNSINELKIKDFGYIINSTNNNEIVYNEFITKTNKVSIIDNKNNTITSIHKFITDFNVENKNCPQSFLNKVKPIINDLKKFYIIKFAFIHIWILLFIILINILCNKVTIYDKSINL